MFAPWRRTSSQPWSVRGYLSVIVVIAVAAFVLAGGYGYLWSAHQARVRALADLDYSAARVASAVAADVQEARRTVQQLAAQSGLAGQFSNPRPGCRLAAGSTREFPSLRLDIVRADGLVTCSSGTEQALAEPTVHAHSRWLARVLKGGPVTVRWNETDAVTKRRTLVVAAAVRVPGPAGQVASGPGRLGSFTEPPAPGAVVMLLHTDVVGQALAGDFGGPRGMGFTIVDGLLDTVVNSSMRPDVYTGDQLDQFFEQSGGQWRAPDGSKQLFGSSPVRGSTWRVYAGLRTSTVLAASRGAFARACSVGLVALLLLLGAVWLLRRRVATPLGTVTAALVRAGRDPHGERVVPVGSRELITLAGEVNAMLDVRAGFEAELVHQATHDRLTGLPNRGLLLERLRQLLAETPDLDCTVLSLGLNRFNLVNDSLGHEAADRVLVEVAGRLGGVVPLGGMLSRHGGAEFVMVCPGTGGRDAIALAEKLGICVERSLRGPAEQIVLSAATGIAVRQLDQQPEQLLREAHSAMHQAKRAGLPWTLFDQSFQARATAHLQTERELRRALERGELVLRYQPLMDVSTGTIVGAEALVRWQHPLRGLIPPAEFLPVAEQTGQIVAIGDFVLREACRQASAWSQAGHRLRISVNVAAEQFQRPDFAGTVEDTLGGSGLAAEQLCLEITESALMNTTEQGAWDLGRIRHLGVHLSIDDFGTGYSSLSYLHDLPVDELKIDRSFVSRLDRQGDDHLVEAIIRMARALSLNVVAEGVETDDQLGRLTGLGCPVVQGFLIAEPTSPERLIDLVEAEHRGAPVAG